MARSFRAEPELEERLERAARVEGVPVSQFIREAVRERCARILGVTLKDELSDVIGAVPAPEGAAAAAAVVLAERSGDAFRDLLQARRATDVGMGARATLRQ